MLPLTASVPRRTRRLLLPLLALALALSVLAVAPTAAEARPTGYTPSAGATFNDPLGSRSHRRAILRKLLLTIDAVPSRGRIRIASWNVRSDAIVAALARAHRRHVGVRVILDQLNANPSNPNAGITWLERQLAGSGNRARKERLRSGVRRCTSSCRGRGGIAHSKFFLFSRAGRADWVVINGGNNATDLAASNQWNDVYTVRGDQALYAEFGSVFDQMWDDREVRPGYRSTDYGAITTQFFPYTGRGASGDPVLNELAKVRCGGALGQPGQRTRIRIAMTSWHGARGIEIARKVRALATGGCQVRIVYAVMGNEVLRILRRGGPRPVPLRHIVRDVDADGVYDSYLHMKTMTVSGHFDGDPRARFTMTGSANWTPVAKGSDEANLLIHGRGVLRRYNRWIDHLFHHPPVIYPNGPPTETPGGPVDRYAKVEVN